MPSNGTTSAVVYKKITVLDPAGETWDVSPFDNNGKVIPEQYIELDMAIGNLALNFPNLASFGGVYNTKINVLVVNGGLTLLSFLPFNVSQQFGSTVGAVSGPALNNICFTFEPISATEWSWNLTL